MKTYARKTIAIVGVALSWNARAADPIKVAAVLPFSDLGVIAGDGPSMRAAMPFVVKGPVMIGEDIVPGEDAEPGPRQQALPGESAPVSGCR